MRRSHVRFARTFVVALAGLLLMGFGVAALAAQQGVVLTLPPRGKGLGATVLLVVSCLATGYGEEFVFRFGAPALGRRMGLHPILCVGVATLLFGLSHVSAGRWAVMNAILAGLILAGAYQWGGSFHGIALAHGCYDLIAFVTAA